MKINSLHKITIVMKKGNAMVAIYDSHEEAEQAVKKLQQSGYDMKNLSIVGKDYHTAENVVGYYNTGDRMKQWGGNGAFWGSIWGMLVGSAFFMIPGVGPVIIAGTFVSALVGALEGAVIVGGMSALGAALVSLGIPEDSIVEYETEIKAGKFMLLTNGTEAELSEAREVLGLKTRTMAMA
jgi:uncharacterized membrane protein